MEEEYDDRDYAGVDEPSVSIDQFGTEFREFFERCVERAEDRVVLVPAGKIVGAIVPMPQLRMLERFEDDYDATTIAIARARADDEAVPWEEVKKELGL